MPRPCVAPPPTTSSLSGELWVFLRRGKTHFSPLTWAELRGSAKVLLSGEFCAFIPRGKTHFSPLECAAPRAPCGVGGATFVSGDLCVFRLYAQSHISPLTCVAARTARPCMPPPALPATTRPACHHPPCAPHVPRAHTRLTRATSSAGLLRSSAFTKITAHPSASSREARVMSARNARGLS